jgi:hypothetical protein
MGVISLKLPEDVLETSRRRDPKAEGRGSKFRTLQPSDRLTRPASLASLAQLTRYVSRLTPHDLPVTASSRPGCPGTAFVVVGSHHHRLQRPSSGR